jgi:hypothetical protein
MKLSGSTEFVWRGIWASFLGNLCTGPMTIVWRVIKQNKCAKIIIPLLIQVQSEQLTFK